MMELSVDRNEVKRYLGYGRTQADAQVSQAIEDCVSKLKAVVSPRVLYQIFPLRLLPENQLDLEGFQTVSENLTKNLAGCERVVLFAATLGIQVDQQIARYCRLHISEGVIMQAAATAMIEEYCDICQEEIRGKMKPEWYLRPRFSPGYGDFSLEHQKDIIHLLQCPKKIGLTVTDSLLLAPIKSVTAVIGLSRRREPCHKHGCEECEKANCQYRR